MPARTSRKDPAAAPGTSSLNGSKKRAVEETQQHSPSARRSKRTRLSAALDLPDPLASNTTLTPHESFQSTTESNEATIIGPSSFESPITAASEVEVKVEKTEHLDTITGSQRIRRAVNKRISYAEDETADTSVNETKEEEEKPIIHEKPTRKRKTKERKEAVMTPLAARTKGLQMFVGAHVSAAKGVQNSVLNSVHIGGNAFALFLKSQRKWDNPPLQDDHREQFRKFCLQDNYDAAKYILPHGSYLVNLAQEDKSKAKQAYDSFLDDLRRCEQLGIRLYNFHPGAVGQSDVDSAITRVAKALTNALSATSTVTPVLETMCGHGTTIGGPLSDLGAVISQIPTEYHSRIGVCVDTCHSFAYGYDLVSREGFQAFMKEFDDEIGLEFLRALHLNDSKAPRGSRRDLHANIGTGFLGLRAFHNVMNEERFQGLPMILETPIDRPDPSRGGSEATAVNGNRVEDEDVSEPDSDSPRKNKSSKKVSKPPSKRPPTIEDKSVWAREIKLLESLVGMDPEGAEFRSVEAQLAEEGRAEREKHQDQYDRKLEAGVKMKQKEAEKGQRNLLDMMNGKRRGGKKGTDNGSELN